MDLTKYLNDRIDNSIAEITGKKDDTELLVAAALLHGALDFKKQKTDRCLTISEIAEYATVDFKNEHKNDLVKHLAICDHCAHLLQDTMSVLHLQPVKISNKIIADAFKCADSKKYLEKEIKQQNFKNFIPAIIAVPIMIIMILWVLFGGKGDSDQPDDYKVKTDQGLVLNFTKKDEADYLNNVSQNAGALSNDSYGISQAKILRDGYIYFILQNSSYTGKLLDVAAGDISSGSAQHTQLVVDLAQGSSDLLLKKVNELDSKYMDYFNLGYMIAYASYKLEAHQDTARAVSFIKDYINDDSLLLNKYVDVMEDGKQNEKENIHREIVSALINLRLIK